MMMRGHRRKQGTGSCKRPLSSPMADDKEMEDDRNKDGAGPHSQTQRYKLQARKKGSQGTALHGRREEKQLRSKQRQWNNAEDTKSEDEPHSASRPRNIRFSLAENMILVSKLLPLYDQLLGKQKTTISFTRKSQMWKDICGAVNGVGHRQRNVHHCKKRFSDIKRQVRNKLNREKSNDTEASTPVHVFYTKYEEELKKVLPAEVIDGFEFFDSDQPQDLNLEEEAGPSQFSQPQDQEQQKETSISDTENPLSLDSESDVEEMPTPTDLTQTSTMNSHPSEPRDKSPDSVILQTKVSTKKKTHGQHKTKSRHSSNKKTNATLCRVPAPTQYLSRLKASQLLFRKSVKHELNVLHLDFCQVTHHVNTNYHTAKKMLQIETQRNHILLQMNDNIDRLAESIQLLANQQQTERGLMHDLLQEPRWNQSACPKDETPAAPGAR